MFWSQNKQTYKKCWWLTRQQRRENTHTVLTYHAPEESLQSLKLTANIFLEAGSTCCLVSVRCLPTLLVHKILQWLHVVWCWLSASFQLESPRATSATVGPSRAEHVSSVSLGQVLTCRFRVYGYHSLETSVCWVYFFLMYHIIKSYCQESFKYSGSFCFLLF